MNPLELAAAALGLINVVLVVRRSVWNFPFGLASVAAYAFIFAQAEVRLYSDAALQVFFFALNLYGWWTWSRSAAADGEVMPRALTPRTRLLGAVGVILVTAAWGAVMARYTDAALPWGDAFIAVASLVAQLLLARRFIENWLLWIVVDMVAIGVYAASGLVPTAFLYVILLVLSAWGWIGWRRILFRK